MFFSYMQQNICLNYNYFLNFSNNVDFYNMTHYNTTDKFTRLGFQELKIIFMVVNYTKLEVKLNKMEF